MDRTDTTVTTIRFGDFELLPESGELRKHGMRVRLSGQAFDTLVLLVAARGRIVSREELQKALWSESSFGDFEHGLNAAINRLRGALGDSATDSKFIETVPRRGYRFIHSLVETESDKKMADDDFEPEIETAVLQPLSRRRVGRDVWFGVLLALLLIAAAIIGVHLVRRRSWSPPADVKEVPLTTLPGWEVSPTFSPDGSQIAFGWNGETDGAEFDLYVQTVGEQNPRRLTHDSLQSWMSAAWSPDGRYIAVRAGEQDLATIQLIPATGGPGRPITPLRADFHYAGQLNWSRDSKTIAFVEEVMKPHTSAIRVGLYFLSLDSLQATFVETGCAVPTHPKFNPVENTLAFVCMESMIRSSINLLHLGTGKVDRLLEIREESKDMGMDWSVDGRFLFYSLRDPGGGKYIWKMDVAHPERRWRLPLAHDASGLTVSRDGDRLAYLQTFSSANIWKVNLTGQPKAESLIASTRRQNAPNFSPDGTKIAFESDRTGWGEVWIADGDGHNLQQVTRFGSLTGTPRWSPDSRYLALDSRVEGKANIYVYDSMGGTLRKVSTSTESNSLPSWSNDGRFLFYASGKDIDAASIWRVPVAGGAATKIVDNGDLPIPSPDGTHLFFRRLQVGSIGIMRIGLDGSDIQTVAVLPEADSSAAWWPSGGGLYILNAPGGKDRIEYLDLATGQRRIVYNLPKHSLNWIGGVSVSADGKWFLYTQLDMQSADLYMLTGLNSFEQR
jgi:Tol biopolymer transport system component/DNA-binding winged helix-turn-helix (wHTH) protein